MPRVNYSFTRKNNMVKDLAKFIISKLYEADMTQEDVAKEMNITQQAFSYRMQMCKQGKDTFSYGDLLTLFKETGATDEEILRIMKL